MYYITKKDSETGKNFQKILDKGRESNEEIKAFTQKYGFKQYRQAHFSVFGGISSCIDFEGGVPDKKIWGKGATKGEFMPKRNSKKGRIIAKEIDDLKQVSYEELNACVGILREPFSCIGADWSSDKYFGFSVPEKWGKEAPDDCEEVTSLRYKEIFKK